MNHIQKIKPRVEQVCRELGLQYTTEDNAGRIYINLSGGEAVMPPVSHHAAPHPSHQQYPGQQNQPYHAQQQPQQQDELEQVVNAILPKIMRKLEKACCVVM